MPGIIGKKIGMTSVFGPEGESIACTVIQAGPCVVTQVKNPETDVYRAVQLAYGDKKEKHSNKAEIGHFKKAGTGPKREVGEVREFREEFEGKVELGAQATVQGVWAVGQYGAAVGVSTGNGFQGVVRGHGFSGVGEQAHGQHNRLRAPGSMGNASFDSRAMKGKKLAGRMGNERVMVTNLQVVRILPEENVIVVSGSVPGSKNSTVILVK